jgi:FkbM family methyltransferase
MYEYDASVNKLISTVKNQLKDVYFKTQKTTLMTYEGFEMKIPSRHSLKNILEQEPFRNCVLKLVSKHFLSEARNCVIDVGANIGDTALSLQVGSSVKTEFILIEPSTFYQKYLRLNQHLFEKSELKTEYISPNYPIIDLRNKLRHWGGTALLVNSRSTIIKISEQVALHSLTTERTGIIKIDCDGNDLPILENFLLNTSFFPALYYENAITGQQDLGMAKRVITLAMEKGYKYGAASSCDGLLLWGGELDTDSINDIFQYQFNLVSANQASKLYYTDILLIQESDHEDFRRFLKESRELQEKNLF